jgi:uncharacterized protein (TIGR00661 family)
MAKILFAVSSWGLGHATRDLVLIQALLQQGHQVTVISTGRALTLLQRELGDQCEFIDWPDGPKPLAASETLAYAKFTLALPLLLRSILVEHQTLQELLATRKFDRIVSDFRYGIYSSKVPTYLISHGLRLIAPNRNPTIELAFELFNARWFEPMRRILVPDFETPSLAGDLCHNLRFFDADKLEYIGILSSICQRDVEQDISYFISVSGPEPQRSIFERMVLRQAASLPGRVVVALGRPEEDTKPRIVGSVEVYNYLDRRRQEEMMNRAQVVVTRSGYTTLMELTELQKRALLVPTPGQTEQTYLARYHRSLGTYFSVDQSKLNLLRDTGRAAAFSGFRPPHRTREAVEKFLSIVTS